MITPYDWQEGIGNRSQFVENRLKLGSPVLAVSIDDGIVMLTFGKGSRKLFEVYDRIGMGAIGQQSDVENLRTAAVDFAHREGFNRSEEDVNVKRVATALSQPMKKAFADFSYAPLVVRCLLAEVGETPDSDVYYALDFDGDFHQSRRNACVVGERDSAGQCAKELGRIVSKTSPKKAVEKLKEIWSDAMSSEEEEASDEEWLCEAILIRRSDEREDRFEVLERSEI